MYPEPFTPLRLPKKRKTGKAKTVDDQVAQFLAFEGDDCDLLSTQGSRKDKWLLIYEDSQEPSIEERVELFLSSKGAFRDSVENLKYEFFNSKKEVISKVMSSSGKSSQEADSPITKLDPIDCSRLAFRRLGKGPGLFLSDADLESYETLSKQRAISLQSNSELDLDLTLVQRRLTDSTRNW